MKKETVFYGTVILIIKNILNKALSLLYRGILIRYIGADGIGMMEMINPIFSLLPVIASWGVPMAISNKISITESNQGQTEIFYNGLNFFW